MYLPIMFFLRLILLISFGFSPLSADGILAYKNQTFHNDKDAQLIRYSSVESKGLVTWVVSEGKRIRLEKKQPHVWVELPNTLPSNIVLPHEITGVSEKVTEIREFVRRFPKAKEASKATFELYISAEENLKKGKVRYQGEWMESADYKSILAENMKRDAEAQAALVKAREDRIKLEQAIEARKIAELESIKAKEKAEKEAIKARQTAIKSRRIQELEAEIQNLETENARISAEIRGKFLQVAKTVIDKQL